MTPILRFGEITGEDGVKTELTHGNYIKFLESPKREVRKAAFEATYDTYARFKNTFSSLLDANFKTSALSAGSFTSSRRSGGFAV